MKERKISLRKAIEGLGPLNSKSKIDELINMMIERNSHLNCYVDKWICKLIVVPSLIEYYESKKGVLKFDTPATKAIPFISDLLLSLEPIDNESKVDKLYSDLMNSEYTITKKDSDFIKGVIKDPKARNKWEDIYTKGKELKLHVDVFPAFKAISVPQPLAALLITGLVDEIAIDNYYVLKEKDVIYVYATDYTKEMMHRIKNNTVIFGRFLNGMFSGSLTDDVFPGNCYLGKFSIGKKISKGVEQLIAPRAFDEPIVTNYLNNPEKYKRSSHLVHIKHIELEGRTIMVPISDSNWEDLEKQEDSMFFYWEEEFAELFTQKSHEDYVNGLFDHDEDDISYGILLGQIAGDEKGLYDVVFINGEKQKRFIQLDEGAVQQNIYNAPNGDYYKVLEFNFENLSEDEVIVQESSFEILQKKEWILDWNCVNFKQGYFVVVPPTDGSVKFKPEAVSSPGVLESFNYLKDYLNDRLQPVHCTVEGMKLTIYDKIRLSEAIEKFATASRQRGIKTSGITTRRIAPQQMSFKQALSKAQQMTPEDFKKYKSEYIDYLVNQQSEKYKVIPCVERLAHTTGDTTEYAFLFSIQCKSGDILIVHENVNPDRSTLLFIVKCENYDKSIRAIYDFLQSAEINKRSSIRSGDIDKGEVGIECYNSINHDYLYSWKRVIASYKRNYLNGLVYW